MSDIKRNGTVQHDVIQRYCPKRGENVVMLRTFGETPRLQCMGYDNCDLQKDPFCGGEAIAAESKSQKTM